MTSNLTGRKSIPIMFVALALAATLIVFFVAQSYFRSLDIETANSRLSLFERYLDEALSRYQYLPFILSQDQEIQGSDFVPENRSLNEKLAQFAKEAELEAIYLMDTSGLVIAASNHNQQPSFLGNNYGFRPYFKTALEGGRGNYFGVGATTGRPGYFVSEPVRSLSGDIKGVVAIKLDASELQRSWENTSEDVLAVNPDNVVVLASNKDWLYRSLNPISQERLTQIRASKQFAALNVSPMEWEPLGASSVRLEGRTYTLASADVAYLDWRIHFLLDGTRSYERAVLATAVFGSMIAVLMGIATFFRSKRIQSALVASQSDRLNLMAANQMLENAQAELAKASKLAALGQLSASVVHELGQPISALRNYLTAEELNADASTLVTLNKLSAVVYRMEKITSQLRFFTKPGDEKIEPVMLGEIVSGALELTRHDIEAKGVKLSVGDTQEKLVIQGNRIRLEQVLVNLITNSLASLSETPTPKMSIASRAEAGKVFIEVYDNGPGFGDRSLETLQEPFHTTRASGDGMGLGLSISTAILKEHDGALRAVNHPDGGALFTIELPLIDLKGSQDNEA